MDTYYDAKCTTCGHPVVRGYHNTCAGELCCDPCHGPYLEHFQVAQFRRFHGRKATKMMRRAA